MPSNKKARVDPNPSSVGKKAKKDATALAVFDPKKPFFVYEIFRPDLDNKTVYVGRTDDVKRRSGQHVMASSPCKLVNELRKLLQVKTFRDIIKLVPELPEGVPASRIVEMEAYFIMERRTVYHARDNEHGCNAKNGDSVHEITPDRYNEIEAELANGYEWPASVGVKNDVPVEVAKARGVEVVFDGLLEEAEETGEDDEFVQALRRDMALVTADRETTEKTYLTSRKMVEELADKYKNAQLDCIDREQFAKELNRVKEKINLDGTDEVINGIVNSVLLAAKVQRVVTMSSNAAAGFVTGIAEMLATREEERLVWKNETVKKRMHEVRAWSRRNGGMKKPMQKKDGSEEDSLGNFLSLWKRPNARDYGGECTDLTQSLVLFRDFGWFKDIVGRKDSLKSVAAEANKQLKDGFAHKDEPTFFGMKPLKSGSNGSDQYRVYHKIDGMVRGGCKLADVEKMIYGLPETRAAWYRKQWSSKEKQVKAVGAKRKAESKRKREEAATAGTASSASVPEANDDDDNGEANEANDDGEESDE